MKKKLLNCWFSWFFNLNFDESSDFFRFLQNCWRLHSRWLIATVTVCNLCILHWSDWKTGRFHHFFHPDEVVFYFFCTHTKTHFFSLFALIRWLSRILSMHTRSFVVQYDDRNVFNFKKKMEKIRKIVERSSQSNLHHRAQKLCIFYVCWRCESKAMYWLCMHECVCELLIVLISFETFMFIDFRNSHGLCWRCCRLILFFTLWTVDSHLIFLFNMLSSIFRFISFVSSFTRLAPVFIQKNMRALDFSKTFYVNIHKTWNKQRTIAK